MIIAIVVYWILYILVFSPRSHYAAFEFAFFREASFTQILSIMDFGGHYVRFSPLGFGLVGYLDSHFLVPLLGGSDATSESLAVARRLTWLHPLLCGLTVGVAALVVRRLFSSTPLAVVAAVLVGLSDGVAFQMRFVSTFVCYGLQIAAFLAIFYLVRLEERRDNRTILALFLCVLLALSLWEQGLNLAFAVSACLVIQLLLKRRSVGTIRALPEFRALAAIAGLVLVYLAYRLPSGAAEALNTSNESSYFLSYGNPLAMLDDLILNASGLVLQAFRQFLPMPPLSFSVMADIDMSELNTYNASFSQYPNMFYRMMGLWYSGLAFAVFIALVVYVIRLAAGLSGRERAVIIAALCIFLFGFVMHLPIMHRDYFYIPGYALGYKISIGYAGFVVLIVVLVRRIMESGWFRGLTDVGRRRVLTAGASYFVGAAILRSALLDMPNLFPW